MYKEISSLYLTDTWVFYVCSLRCIQHRLDEIIDLFETMTMSYDPQKISMSVIFITLDI